MYCLQALSAALHTNPWHSQQPSSQAPSALKGSRVGGEHSTDIQSGAGLRGEKQPVDMDNEAKDKEKKDQSIGEKAKSKLAALTSSNTLTS